MYVESNESDCISASLLLEICLLSGQNEAKAVATKMGDGFDVRLLKAARPMQTWSGRVEFQKVNMGARVQCPGKEQFPEDDSFEEMVLGPVRGDCLRSPLLSILCGEISKFGIGVRSERLRKVGGFSFIPGDEVRCFFVFFTDTECLGLVDGARCYAEDFFLASEKRLGGFLR